MGLFGIIAKEFKHITRDYRTLAVLFLLPILMMILFGYAMTLEISNIKLVIEDQDNSYQSRELIRSFAGSSFFVLVKTDISDHTEIFQRRLAHAILTIPRGYAENAAAGRAQPELNLSIDASDSNRAVIIRQYITGVITRSIAGDTIAASPLRVLPAFLYNRELESSFFFVPGLTALLILMVSALLTSLTITREKEQGTFDLIKLAPVHAFEIIIGKVLPYLVLAMFIGFLILFCGFFFFSIPMRGSVVALFFYILLYCLTGLSFGMLISTVAGSQQVAMMISMMATMLPTLFLSGFMFQLAAMPKPLQLLSWIVPAKYFLVIIRGLILKGNSQSELLFQSGMLLLFSMFYLTLAIRRFRHYLEN